MKKEDECQLQLSKYISVTSDNEYDEYDDDDEDDDDVIVDDDDDDDNDDDTCYHNMTK